MTPTPSAYTPNGMCSTPSAYAPYVHPPPTPQADADAAMLNAYNEPERRETSDGRFWTAREFYMAYGDNWSHLAGFSPGGRQCLMASLSAGGSGEPPNGRCDPGPTNSATP